MNTKEKLYYDLLIAGDMSFVASDDDVSKQGMPILMDKGAFTALYNHEGCILAAGVGFIAYSKDMGSTWEFVSLGQPLPIVTAFHTTAKGHLLAATLEDGVFVSEDDGVTWNAWNFGLVDYRVNGLTTYQQQILAATSIGIYASHNDGRSWQRVRWNSHYEAISAIEFSGSQLFIGTEENGLYRVGKPGEYWKRCGDFDQPILSLKADSDYMYVLSGNEVSVSKDVGQSWEIVASNAAAIYPVENGLTILKTDGQIQQVTR